MSETRQTQTITHRHTGAVIYSVEAETFLKAIERAVLTGADLSRANLYGANLSRANVTGANLTYDQLIMAKLEPIKMDFWGRLCCFPAEVDALRVALIDGRVNGSCYEGECSCFIGTVATARGIKYDAMPELKPDGNSATERWFLAIETGDKIETNPIVRITVEWIDEWDARMGSEVKA